MKHLPLIFLFFCISNNTLLSQDSEQFSDSLVYTIYLKGGEYETGYIQEETDGVLVVRKLDETVVRIPHLLIRNVRKQLPKHFYTKKGFSIKREGWYHTIAVGMSGDQTESGAIQLRGGHIHTTHGKYLNKRFAYGGGIGYDAYKGYARDWYGFIPVYAEGRFSFLDSRIYPYASMGLGVGFLYDSFGDINNGEYVKPGIFAKPAIGFVISGKAKLNVFFEISYHFQRAKIRYERWRYGGGPSYPRLEEMYEGPWTARFLNTTVGVLF